MVGPGMASSSTTAVVSERKALRCQARASSPARRRGREGGVVRRVDGLHGVSPGRGSRHGVSAARAGAASRSVPSGAPQMPALRPRSSRASASALAQAVADARLGDQPARARRVALELARAAAPCRRARSDAATRSPAPRPRAGSARASARGRRGARAAASSRYSIGVSCTSSPPTRDDAAREVHDAGRRPGRVPLLARVAPRAVPQRDAHAREQLAHRERLGDVVVGAGVERADLVLVLAARGEHHDRHLRSTRAAGAPPRSRRGPAARGRAAPGRARASRRAPAPPPRSPPRPGGSPRW